VVGRAGGGGSCDDGTGGADTFPTVPIRLHLRISGISKSARGEKPKLRIDIDIYEYQESTSYFDARIRPNSTIDAHLKDLGIVEVETVDHVEARE